MANIRNSNTFFIDTAAANTSAGTTGNLAVKSLAVDYILVTATSANADLILKDVTTGATKFRLDVQNANESQEFSFEQRPVVFPNGISPTTVTNCVATVVIREARS